jgi:hypothetical protein
MLYNPLVTAFSTDALNKIFFICALNIITITHWAYVIGHFFITPFEQA